MLNDLSLSELLILLDECRSGDQQSAVVLKLIWTVLPDDWRSAGAGAGNAGSQAGGGPAWTSGGAMTREEAYEILGLQPGATTEEIKDAHKRLMLKMHPIRADRHTSRQRSIRRKIC